MEWTTDPDKNKVPIKSWCNDIDQKAMDQADILATHPAAFHHIALMPDCHPGYGMPIGGVLACEKAVIPNAVGVDIGCGMGAINTGVSVSRLKPPEMDFLSSNSLLRSISDKIKMQVPCGEGHAHKTRQKWKGFEQNEAQCTTSGWFNKRVWELARLNLGTLGGGNHFIEIQAGDDDNIWLMIHSGSRNLGYVIASFYHRLAQELNAGKKMPCPHKDLSWLPLDSELAIDYLDDMNFALEYAAQNRKEIMKHVKEAFASAFPEADFSAEQVNIHHNYAAPETHFGKEVWVHRKGATSAQKGETGIIPGSMGAPSFIVKGLGNPESFHSCSHGSGRVMGRNQASRSLSVDDCNRAMEGIVFDRWRKKKRGRKQTGFDLGEAPQAYKNVEQVIKAQLDLIEPIVKLTPLCVIKG